MKIICAGMRRSASTWLYNIVRLALNERGGFEDTWANDYRFNVVKTHKFDDKFLFGADAIVTSHRDLRDVAASAVRRRLIEPQPIPVVRYLLRAVIDEYDAWLPYACFDMHYEDFAGDKVKQATVLIEALKIDADANHIATLVENLPMPTGKADREILLDRKHFTDGRVGSYKETLDARTICAIEAVFGEWLTDKGYKI